MSNYIQHDKCSTNSKPISSIYKIKKTVPTECPKVLTCRTPVGNTASG